MPPYAICSIPNCPFLFNFKDEREGQSQIPPNCCRVCQNSIIWFCPVCAWPLLTIPRQDMPMCCNCWGRLRQHETLLGKRAEIRKMILFAVLNRAKLINDAPRNPEIKLNSATQSCLLLFDLYRTDRQLPAEMVVKPSIGCCQTIGVRGEPSGTSVYMRSASKTFPKVGRFIAYGTDHTGTKLVEKPPQALRMIRTQNHGNP
jgi:hypothetical protein